MDNKEIKTRCIDFATRGAGIHGFVPGQIIKHAEVFYNWVTEGNEDTPKVEWPQSGATTKAPSKPKGRPKKARTR